MRNKKISREELLNCALEIIKENGLKACTIRSLATSSGIAVGTVYNYFSSQEELFNEIFVSSWTKTIERLKNAVDTTELSHNKLSAYTMIMLEEIRNRKGLGEVVITSQSSSMMTDSTSEGLFRELSLIIKEIVKDGESNIGLSDDEMLMISHWVLGAIFSHISNQQCTDDRFVNQLTARFL